MWARVQADNCQNTFHATVRKRELTRCERARRRLVGRGAASRPKDAPPWARWVAHSQHTSRGPPRPAGRSQLHRLRALHKSTSARRANLLCTRTSSTYSYVPLARCEMGCGIRVGRAVPVGVARANRHAAGAAFLTQLRAVVVRTELARELTVSLPPEGASPSHGIEVFIERNSTFTLSLKLRLG